VQSDDHDRTKFVVGLGNPGRRYEQTRHNLGFRVLAALCRRWQAGPHRAAFQGLLWEARIAPPEGDPSARRRVMLLGPQTYMNQSGLAVGELVRFYKAGPEDVLMVLDDMALWPGLLRARAGGSAGGHNGLADVLRALGTDQVPRLRIGIGAPPPEMDPVDFVLTRFGPEEEPVIESAIQTAAEAVEDWVLYGMRAVMDRYNRKAQQQEP